jgi:UDP-2,3-diacylglucosamine pyrophosphatase LpxH
MLVIVSDIHLGDGTCGKSISPTAFTLFSERLRELAFHASFRNDGHYQPVKKIDLVLLGDILDPLHSSLWLDTQPGEVGYIRPWSDPANPWYTAKLQQVTRAILKENQPSVNALKRLASEEILRLPPAVNGVPDFEARERIAPRVKIHYMVGNHDWFYHLPGPGFDAIRQELIETLGLSNPVDNFPWEIAEHEPLQDVFARYKVYGQHGDKYDKFNYDRERGRDSSTLGDVFAVEVLNRYPVVVAQQLGAELPPAIIDSLRMLTNVRPALATSLWISGQIRQHAGNSALECELKKIWDQITEEFLQIDFVREADKAFQFDLVDAMEMVVGISKRASFKTINDLAMWVRDKMWEGEISYANHALHEPAFLDNSARYIVYGHTHHHETIPLDAEGEPPYEESQIYFNAGTWRSYYELAVRNIEAQKFVPYQSMTYLTFYEREERGERHFEAWTGAFA